MNSIREQSQLEVGYRSRLGQLIWVILTAGLMSGLLLGILLRVAMLVLRLASPGSAGLVSDDGFVIGQVTAAGTYNLMMFSVALGVVGSAGYVAIRPFLLGPRAVQVASVAGTAMTIGATAAIHADGVDFTALDTSLAVALFIVVPLIGGLAVPIAVQVASRASRRPVWLPGLVLLHPLTATVAGIVAVAVALVLLVRGRVPWRLVDHRFALGLVRSVLAVVPLLAGVGLVLDIAELY